MSMTQSETSVDTSPKPPSDASRLDTQQATPSKGDAGDNPSYIKLAMRNMVKKGGTSLVHFSLSALGLLTLLMGLAYLTR